ncbi:MAG: membrane dipeptidase [Acidimicrobiales bacterium]
MATRHGPWIDVHAHPGRCFLAGAPPGDPLSELLGGDGSAGALRAARAAGLTAVSFATVADLLVLAPKSDGGLHAGREFRPGEAHADHQRQLAGLVGLAEREGAPIAMTAADLERAHATGATALLITCEGGDFLEGDVDRLDEAHAQGMSSLTLVHYRVNELGDIQTDPPRHDGLTSIGRAVVERCNALGVVIDCAHATFATTLGVLDVSSVPVMVSHSHLDRADRSHPRLLSDDHARAVADAGGLLGAWPSGVTSETLDDFVDEIVRLVELVGVTHVAIGTDLDANYKPVVTEHAQLAVVAEHLRRRGLTAAEADRVLGGNVVELYRAVAG